MKEYWAEREQFFYFEVDIDGTVYRQMIKNSNQINVSNRYDFCLSEKEVPYCAEKQIDKEEFDYLWKLGNKPFELSWNDTKKSVSIGMSIEGYIEVIYPQGIIINLGNDKYGISDYDECKNRCGSENIYTKNKIKGKVFGFDEKNLWVKINEAQVIVK